VRDDAEFKVGQFVRYNSYNKTQIGEDQGIPAYSSICEQVDGKIVAIHKDNKRCLEIEDRKTKKHSRVVPRNVIEIIPEDRVVLSFEEKLSKEIEMFKFHIGQTRHLSDIGKQALLEHLIELNDLFRSKTINSFLT